MTKNSTSEPTNTKPEVQDLTSPDSSKKPTALEDDADIYTRRNVPVSEKQKWNELNRSQKWQYFKDYYLLKVIVTVIAVAFLCNVLWETFGPQIDTVYYGAVLYDDIDDEKLKELETAFSEYLNISTKKQRVTIDDNFNFTNNSTALSGEEKLTTYMYAEQVDTITVGAEEFAAMSYNGIFKDLDVILPEDLKSALSEYFVTGTVEDYADTEFIMGIDLSKCEKYQSLSPYVENPVIGIAYNSQHVENTIAYLRYLFDLTED
ncbi:hypothetical protein [Anaeromicropila populeti]|uniref:Uncharacterized protein n=1 Tax=Anaeromicropila populeti TaxID=37658 RepID=A0A1I6JZ33_9FIRM|nr:hypothetical protein [Anaeromicropila populeti]SFR84227.1 hypothetical protein SAMN05661086_02108 [Anaeromicropila populeti]